MSYRITTIAEENFREIAEFLHTETSRTGDGAPAAKDAEAQYRDLTHRLLKNPFRQDGFPHGYCVRDGAGMIAGALLLFPWHFRWGSRRLVALVSGKFFVSEAARMQGFLLFRRYLALRQADLFLATTCNALSGRLWDRSGGMPLSHSDHEYTLPIDLGAIVEELALRKLGSASVAAVAGRIAGLLNWLRIRRRPALAAIDPCCDWELLARIAEANRRPDLVENDRTLAYLAWTYGRFPAVSYRFTTAAGEEGWFALGRKPRGLRGQINAVEIVDWSLPRDVALLDLVQEAAEIVRATGGHMLFIKGRCGMDPGELRRSLLERSLANASGYVIGSTVETSRLAERVVVATPDRF